MGEITLHVAQIVITEQCNTMYRTDVVCFRYVTVNAVHKGYNKDDDYDHNRYVDNTRCSLHPVLDTKDCNIMKYVTNYTYIKGKGKAIPLQARCGPEGR